MPPPNNHQEWLAKAEHDFRTADLLIAAGGPWDNVCYHSQQAVEKLLKAFLIAQGIPPKKIHDLGALLQDCGVHDKSLMALEDECDLLTAGIIARYPLEDEPDETEARKMRAAAEHIRTEILRRLS
jgi:HEPN domain-containing protein